MNAVARWLGRKAVLYLCLVLALAFFVLLWPTIKSELSGNTVRADLMSPNQIISELRTARAETQKRLTTNIESLRKTSEAGLAQRLQAATLELEEAKSQREKTGSLFDRFRPSKFSKSGASICASPSWSSRSLP